MIVPMKKVFLVVLESKRKEALKKLRAAGLVHLETVEGSGEDLTLRRSEYSKIEQAILLLSDIKLPKEKAKKLALESKKLENSSSDVPILATDDSFDEMISFAENVNYLFETRRNYELLISQNKAELERLQKWGSVDINDLTSLSDNGINLALYEIPSNKYNSIPKEIDTVFVNEDKSTTRFLLLTKDSVKPEGLPAEAFAVTLPEKSTEAMKKDISQYLSEINSITEELYDSVSKLPILKYALSQIAKKVEFENLFSGMEKEGLKTTEGKEKQGSLAWLKGYVPTEDVGNIKKLAQDEHWGYAAVDPTEEDMVPTKLKNNKLVSLIYPVSDFLGTVPGYREYDISGWFLLFFAIFFGIIFGDGGYGLLMVAASFAGMISSFAKKKTPPAAMSLLLLLGLTTVAWGTCTCNWFGIPIENIPLWLKNLSIPLISNVAAAESSEMNNWVSQNLQVFCFGLALTQLSVAHLKGIARYIKSLKAFGELGSLLMLWGMFFVVLNMVVSSERFPLPSFVIPLIAGGFVLSFVFSNYEGSIGKSILESCKSIVSVLLGVVNIFSDIVSYIRLWAVGLAGSAIATTVNDMAGPMLGGLIIFSGILILFFGHGLNMVLNVLSVIVHGVRLNTLEFSSHLGMSWSGFKFDPFSETVKK